MLKWFSLGAPALSQGCLLIIIILSIFCPLENKKHPNFEWRGQGRGVDSYASEVTLFEYNVSTILSPIVEFSDHLL